MRALWLDRPNCSHNVSQKVKRIRRLSDQNRNEGTKKQKHGTKSRNEGTKKRNNGPPKPEQGNIGQNCPFPKPGVTTTPDPNASAEVSQYKWEAHQAS